MFIYHTIPFCGRQPTTKVAPITSIAIASASFDPTRRPEPSPFPPSEFDVMARSTFEEAVASADPCPINPPRQQHRRPPMPANPFCVLRVADDGDEPAPPPPPVQPYMLAAASF
jgi:hypothetical protein